MLKCCDLILRGKYNLKLYFPLKTRSQHINNSNASLIAKTAKPDEVVGLCYQLRSATTPRDLKSEHSDYSNAYYVTMLCWPQSVPYR